MGQASSTEFTGLPIDRLDVLAIADRRARRQAIVAAFHPALAALGRDLVARLGTQSSRPLHAHLPRLDWPRTYQPFCTWLALSHETHGYQAGPQLNVGIHADHVAARLGWDAAAPAFGRFEFLCRHGALGGEVVEAARRGDLCFRVAAAQAWPVGSVVVFESPDDLAGSLAAVRRRGVWWELGRRYEVPAERERLCSPSFGGEVAELFEGLLPLFGRLAGSPRED